MGGFSLWHWLIVIAIVALLFGGKGKISGLRSGQGHQGVQIGHEGGRDRRLAPAASVAPDDDGGRRQHRRRPPGARPPQLTPGGGLPRCMRSMPLRRHARPRAAVMPGTHVFSCMERSRSFDKLRSATRP